MFCEAENTKEYVSSLSLSSAKFLSDTAHNYACASFYTKQHNLITVSFKSFNAKSGSTTHAL